ncbi:UTRA domain-containing protein [Microbacterium sp. SD291]|nr:UTRA domain-containing protein [Microbacterium sp. SD291]
MTESPPHARRSGSSAGASIGRRRGRRRFAGRKLRQILRLPHPDPLRALGGCDRLGADVVYIRRQRSTDGVPVAVLENYLPQEFRDITTDDLGARGLYQILRARGVTIRIAKQKIGARRAEDDESTLLDIDEGGPVLTMERIAFDDSGRAIEYGHHCYRPDMYSFETTLVAK